MQQNLRCSSLLPRGETASADFNVVIAYEDFETGNRARRTCDLLAETLGSSCRFSSQMWKFEILGMPKLREMAVHDAGLADIIIVSCHGSNELPAGVKTWLDLWLEQKSETLALVALFNAPAQDPNQADGIREYLAQVARRGEMEYFAQPYDWPGKPQDEQRVSVRPGSPWQEEALSMLSVVVQEQATAPRWEY